MIPLFKRYSNLGCSICIHLKERLPGLDEAQT